MKREFVPGALIGRAASWARDVARDVNVDTIAKTLVGIADNLPSPGDGPIRTGIKLYGAVQKVREDIKCHPWRTMNRMAEREGAKIHENVSELVRLAVDSKGSRRWLRTRHETIGASGETMHEYTCEGIGRAWLLTWDASGQSFYVDAWLDGHLQPSDLAASVWDSFGGKMRIDVTREGNQAFDRTVMTRVEDLDGELYDEGETRVTNLVDRVRRSSARGEGRTMLFSGGRGRGKSTTAARMTEKLGTTLLVVGASAAQQTGLTALRWVEKAMLPGVTMFDDIDRNQPDDVNAFFTWLASRQSVAGSVTILTANGSLPLAMTREMRVDDMILFRPMSADARRSVLARFMVEYGVFHEIKDGPMARLIEMTEGRGAAAMKDIARRLRDESPADVLDHLKDRLEIEAMAQGE